MLYKYEVESFSTYLSDRRNPVTLLGIEKVENTEVLNTLVDELDKNKHVV